MFCVLSEAKGMVIKMENETMLLKEAVGKINEKLSLVINKIKQDKIRDSAVMMSDILTGIDEIYIILESIYGVNNNIIHDINTRIEKVILAYEKNNSILIKLNVEKLKNSILSIEKED